MSTTHKSFRIIVVSLAIIAVSSLAIAANWGSGYAFGLFTPVDTPATTSPVSTTARHNRFTPGTCDLPGGPFNIEVEATNSANNAGYATLGAAFAAINAGTHTGSIDIDICANTDEGAVPAVLNAGNDAGTGDYTQIDIIPAGGVARSITGAPAGGSPVIDLDGADNVFIDGLNGGGASLSISNTTVSATAGTSTIRLINDASNNLIVNASINGSGTGTATGTVLFGTTTGTTGNDTNAVLACNIGPAGTNLPINGILGSGTAASPNNGITISTNRIFDFFNAGSVSQGVLVGAGNSDWTFNNNRFFQTATRTYTTANTHAALRISNTLGNNFVVTNNIIGFANAGGTGVYAMAGTIATRFIAIDLSVGTTTATSVQGNTFTATTLATTSGAATTNGIICGINLTAGNANIGNTTGNTIGAASGIDAIVATPTSTQGAVVGMHSSSTGTVVIQGNTIGALSSSGTTAAVAGGVFGINVSAAAASITISGNTIGNGTALNMRAGTLGLTTGSSIGSGINVTTTPVAINITGNTIQNFATYGTGTAGFVRGINGSTAINTTASYNVSQNTISNLTTSGAATGYASGNVSAQGIQFSGGLNGTCSQNTISNISNINAAAVTNTVVAGIVLASGQNSSVFRNSISGLSNAGIGTTATAPPVVSGIIVRSGTTAVNVYNNMISIGAGQTTNTSFIGIMLNHGSTPDPVDNIYFNSVNVTGTAAAGAS